MLYFVTLQICWQNNATSKINKGTTVSFFGLWVLFRVQDGFLIVYNYYLFSLNSRKIHCFFCFQTLASYSVGKDSETKSKQHIKSENICIVSCLHWFIFIKPSKACFLSLLLWFEKQTYVPPSLQNLQSTKKHDLASIPFPPTPCSTVNKKAEALKSIFFFPSSGGIQVLWYIL